MSSNSPVFGYVRISEDPLLLRAGVTRQRDDVVRTANVKGWGDRPVRWFEDNDLSAYKATVRRPAFEQMLDELGDAHALIAYNLDRLLRQPRELERVIDRAHEVHLVRVVTAEGDIDLTSHDGQLHARILVAVAKKSSDDTSRRVKRAARDRAERGLRSGGKPPFGYRVNPAGSLTPDPLEAELLRNTVRDLLEGQPLYVCAERLGITPAGLRRLLRSPTIIGQTTMWVPGWEPIIDPATYANVRALLDDRRRVTPRSNDHWLSGVLACANPPCCWRPMVFGGGTTPGYRCLECRNTVQKAGSERIISHTLWEIAAAFQAVEDPTPVLGGDASDRPVDEDAERMLGELAHDYASGLITRSEWLAAREVLVPLPPSHHPAVRPASPPPKNLRAIWPELDGPGRRRQATRLLSRVEVARARRRGVFDPSRLRPVWRA